MAPSDSQFMLLHLCEIQFHVIPGLVCVTNRIRQLLTGNLRLGHDGHYGFYLAFCPSLLSLGEISDHVVRMLRWPKEGPICRIMEASSQQSGEWVNPSWVLRWLVPTDNLTATCERPGARIIKVSQLWICDFYRLCEINVCCFKLLNSWAVCFIAIAN